MPTENDFYEKHQIVKFYEDNVLISYFITLLIETIAQ